YGLLEKQFARLMKDANRGEGQSGEMLLQLLERRLDNVIYRAGFATSRRGARQLVTHGHFLLNGRRVDIPSIRVRVGDEIVVRPHSVKGGYFSQIETIVKDSVQGPLSWLKSDSKKLTVTITGLPKREEAEAEITEQLIVEYYSR
ncbi:MAG TPA: 30S ribosomal protein S4, partial [Candidatus Saccharimonadales bacterium]